MESLRLTKLKIENFRNLEQATIFCHEKMTCIFGDNGNGKTNLLEAIYYLCHHKSFRKKTSFPQILGLDGEKPEIIFSSVFEDEKGKEISYTGKVTHEKGQWYLNGRPEKKSLPIKVVFVNPFDSFHFHQLASFRRQWVDQHLGQLDRDYKKVLNKYLQGLRQKNNLLSKRSNSNEAQIKALEVGLAENALIIIQKRKEFLEKLRPFLKQIFKAIFSEEHELNLEMDLTLSGEDPQFFLEQWQRTRSKELEIGHAILGPHKDDYVLLFDGLNSYDYCSLGQQKMSYLGLLFAYIELIRYKMGSFPMVLIDDVSGELDAQRWKKLVAFLQRGSFQVFITTANNHFKEELVKINHAQNFIVQNGSINPMQQ